MQLGKALVVARVDRVELLLRLRDRGAGLQAADHLPVVAVTLLVALVLGCERRGQPQVHVVPHERERRGHHAHDLVRLGAQTNGSADDVRVAAEVALPHAGRQNGFVLVTGLALRFREEAALQRRLAKDREQRRRCHDGRESLGPFGRAERRARSTVDGDVREHGHLRLAIEIVRHARRAPLGARVRIAVVERDQPLGIRHGERFEHYGPHDAEDRGVGADADGQRQHGGQREAAILDEQPRAEAQVLEHRAKHVSGPFGGASAVREWQHLQSRLTARRPGKAEEIDRGERPDPRTHPARARRGGSRERVLEDADDLVAVFHAHVRRAEAQERADPRPAEARRHGRALRSTCRSRATSTNRARRSASAAHARRPSGVRRIKPRLAAARREIRRRVGFGDVAGVRHFSQRAIEHAGPELHLPVRPIEHVLGDSQSVTRTAGEGEQDLEPVAAASGFMGREYTPRYIREDRLDPIDFERSTQTSNFGDRGPPRSSARAAERAFPPTAAR